MQCMILKTVIPNKYSNIYRVIYYAGWRMNDCVAHYSGGPTDLINDAEAFSKMALRSFFFRFNLDLKYIY